MTNSTKNHNSSRWGVKKLCIAVVLGLITSSTCVAAEMQCILQIQKSPAWSQYDVNVSLHDMATQHPIITFHLPKATAQKPSVNAVTASFDCSRYQAIQFFATFSPAIWQSEATSLYPSKVIWNVSQQLKTLKPGVNEIQVLVKFPDDFADVPDLINPKLFH